MAIWYWENTNDPLVKVQSPHQIRVWNSVVIFTSLCAITNKTLSNFNTVPQMCRAFVSKKHINGMIFSHLKIQVLQQTLGQYEIQGETWDDCTPVDFYIWLKSVVSTFGSDDDFPPYASPNFIILQTWQIPTHQTVLWPQTHTLQTRALAVYSRSHLQMLHNSWYDVIWLGKYFVDYVLATLKLQLFPKGH